jgi:hypothetical protein
MASLSTNQTQAENVSPRSIGQDVTLTSGRIFRVKCFLEPGRTFLGWLHYYGEHYAGYTGSEDTPAGLRFAWYVWNGVPYLWDVDSVKGSARYLGPNNASDHSSAELNLWSWAAGIRYDPQGDQRFRLWNDPSRYCYAAGSGYIYWGDYGEALQFELVPSE